MCLAVPMRVISVNGFVARCEARGVQRDVDLFLLQHETVNLGDELMVHVGCAIEKMSPERAAQAWALYDEMFERLDAAATSHA
jgi:hydrogenase expression/formation protein HypC